MWEREDSCSSGSCRMRGGSFYDTVEINGLHCGAEQVAHRETVCDDWGFRCCSDGQRHGERGASRDTPEAGRHPNNQDPADWPAYCLGIWRHIHSCEE